MKYLLALFMLFPGLAIAAESRITTLHRSLENREIKNDLNPPAQQGQLGLTRMKPIDSLHAYDTDYGRLNDRPQIIDDLYYESLLLTDPTGATETRQALIAKALRIPDDKSYVVFEINENARFQDGTPVTGSDVLYSFEILKESSPQAKAKFEQTVKAQTAQGNEVRLDLSTKDQASVDAILFLAGVKIVKPNTTGATSVGGIKVRFTVTGPYRLSQLGRARLSLVIDPSYWGRSLPARKGYFNFRTVEVVTAHDSETANFFTEHAKPKNENLIHAEITSKPAGARIPALSFNLASPAVQQWQVRQAMLLAYDFEAVNAAHYAGALSRPNSLASGTEYQPKELPSADVENLMAVCPYGDAKLFEARGHAYYEALGDKRVRLLTAMRLLQEAGLKVENGVLKRPAGDGTYIPVHIRMLVKEHEMRAAYLFRADLLRLGMLVTITPAEGDAFRNIRKAGEFELVSVHEGFLDKEGVPSPDRLRLGESQELPCLRGLMQTLESQNPRSQISRDAAEAITRLHEAMVMSIFTGAPAKNNVFHDSRLNIPGKMPVDGIHKYGYWLENEAPWYNRYIYMPGGCVDFGCLFNMAPR